MSSPQRAPRERSAFAAAFFSLIFPGLGHAYAGAFGRALAFAALPLLTLALTLGIALRADRAELLGFMIQGSVLTAIFVLNIVALLYRIAAAVDAWQVARFLNAIDASGGGRLGRARLPLNPLSLAGLLAVLLVMAGGHVAVARYDQLALTLVNCVFSEGGDPSCDLADATPTPGDSGSPDQSADAGSSAGASGGPADTPEALPTPEGTGAGTPAPTLPPWDGKERLNVLLVGVDQRPSDSTFNTDTMIVASVDPTTGQVAMFQLPRDTVDVPVPANVRNLWGSVYRGKINSWFTQNANRPEWPGKSRQQRGFASLKAILGELYGLDINYYVMVNFQGFTRTVDTLGGVQINVQIPVAESTYPIWPGYAARIYIPAGPQHMTGTQALIYARSRHRAAGGDFDRGRRQQRVLVSLREQMSAQAIIANLPDLVATLKGSVVTDIRTSDLPKLLALAESVDTKNIRSYVFAPSFYGSEPPGDSRGYVIEPNIARIRRAVAGAFTVTADQLALQERLGAEAARVWVLNASGRNGLASTTVDALAYAGLEASAPNRAAVPTQAQTSIVVYNGAEAEMADTIAYLEDTFKLRVTTATDPNVTVDMVITLGQNAPGLDAPGVG